MKVGFVSDFSSNVTLDSQILGIPKNGVVLNSGVHSTITIKNLLAYLPEFKQTLSSYSASKEYGDFLESRSVEDLVEDNGIIYQSIKSSNTGNPLTDTNSWIPTNKESIMLKVMINRVKDRVYNELGLVEKLISSHQLYSEGTETKVLDSNYSGWSFQSKGSDYIKFRINEIALQANTTGNVDLYVIYQKELKDTLSIPVDNGKLKFHNINYDFGGKGEYIFAFNSQEVSASFDYIDPNNYEGFTAYTVSGLGSSPESSDYTYSVSHNGLGFNITTIFDPKSYIDNNANEFAHFIRQAFEYEFFEMILHNSGNRRNDAERNLMEKQFIKAQLSVMEGNTVAKRYQSAIKEAKRQLREAYDIQLSEESGDDYVDVEIGSV